MIARQTFAEYAATDAVNWSTLKVLAQSPLHYRHALTAPREDTPALALGRALHTATLEPDRFALEYAVRPDGIDRRTKEGKAKWEAFVAGNEGRTILDGGDYARVLAMRDAVRSHPLVAPYLAAGAAEQTIRWTDPHAGIACKARLDWISESRHSLLDLKSAACGEARRFGAAAARYGYHGQAAFYRDGYRHATGRVRPYLLVVVEKDAPHDVSVFNVEDDALYAGEEEYKRLLAILRDCRARDHWPGRYQEEQTLRLPGWVFPDEEAGADAADLGISFGEGA